MCRLQHSLQMGGIALGQGQLLREVIEWNAPRYGIELASDFIVGFCGETEAQFDDPSDSAGGAGEAFRPGTPRGARRLERARARGAAGQGCERL